MRRLIGVKGTIGYLHTILQQAILQTKVDSVEAILRKCRDDEWGERMAKMHHGISDFPDTLRRLQASQNRILDPRLREATRPGLFPHLGLNQLVILIQR